MTQCWLHPLPQRMPGSGLSWGKSADNPKAGLRDCVWAVSSQVGSLCQAPLTPPAGCRELTEELAGGVGVLLGGKHCLHNSVAHPS